MGATIRSNGPIVSSFDLHLKHYCFQNKYFDHNIDLNQYHTIPTHSILYSKATWVKISIVDADCRWVHLHDFTLFLHVFHRLYAKYWILKSAWYCLHHDNDRQYRISSSNYVAINFHYFTSDNQKMHKEKTK